LPATRVWPLRRRSVAWAGLLCLLAAAVYLVRLGGAALGDDEVVFGLTAQSLANAGRDLNGRFMPLYFPMGVFGRDMWYAPMLLYLSALAVKTLPLSELTIRLPMALAGVLNVALMYSAAALVFESEALALAAGALIALSPAHLAYARAAADFQLPVSFALGWLVCLLVDRKSVV